MGSASASATAAASSSSSSSSAAKNNSNPNSNSRSGMNTNTNMNGNLNPIASTDVRLQRRVSRTDLDFEQALRQEGTVVLKEGRDVSSLGVGLGVDSPGPGSRSFGSPMSIGGGVGTPAGGAGGAGGGRGIARVALQPATPIVVPPTPSPGGPGAATRLGPGSASTSTGVGASGASTGVGASGASTSGHHLYGMPSPASSAVELDGNGGEEVDRDGGRQQVNRRSIYRSPGTASSPDLATLLRRAKERGSPIGGVGKKEKERQREKEKGKERERERKRTEREREREGYEQQTIRQPTGAYSSATLVASPGAFGERERSQRDETAGDWVMANARKEATVKPQKSSVRAKTSALWGKMMGQNATVRERAKTDASLHPMNSFDNPPPPVPAIPMEHRSPIHPSSTNTPSSSSTANSDAYSYSSSTVKRLPTRKPLPSTMSPDPKHSGDTDRSIVFVEKQDSPLPPLPSSPPAPITPKRRSNSVNSGIQATPPVLTLPLLSRAATASASANANANTPLPQTPEGGGRPRKESDALKGMLDVFRGELSVFDPIPLDLRNPSTPPRPRTTPATGAGLQDDDDDDDDEDDEPPEESLSLVVPPRISSLQSSSPPQAAAAAGAGGVQRYPLTPQHQPARQNLPGSGSGPLRSRSGPSTQAMLSAPGYGVGVGGQTYRDGTRLHVLHRSTASSSEPSLVSAVVAADAAAANSNSNNNNNNNGSPSSYRPRGSFEPPPSSFGGGGGGKASDFDALLTRGAAGARGVLPSVLRRGSEHDLVFASPDSAQFSSTLGTPTSAMTASSATMASSTTTGGGSGTPVIVGEEGVEDMESRAKELAGRCWNEDEEFLAKEKIAEWLGGHGAINKVSLKYYIDFFDFAGLRLDLAFRRLCGKLFLKGETQQVDRILEQFSRRYWDCNPTTIYGSTNLVHAVSYSLLLLNTDLHVAELSARMSRSQFVRNTMTAIQMQLQASPDLASSSSPYPSSSSQSYPSPNPSAQLSTSDLTYDDCGSSVRTGIGGIRTGSEEVLSGVGGAGLAKLKRSGSVASWNSGPGRDAGVLASSTSTAHGSGMGGVNGSTQSVHTMGGAGGGEQNVVKVQTHGRAWEMDMETLLKDMYTAIKHQQILQPLSTSITRSSMSSLSPGGPSSSNSGNHSNINGGSGHMLRNRSLRTGAAGAGQSDRLMALKRGSIRGLQSILSVQSGISPYSSNSSIDGRVSPSPSFATSTNEAMYGSSSSFFNPAIGFASNLSHTIIREAQEDGDEHQSVHSEDSSSTTISISDEELALLGAPWAKEGMLRRKQYWESAGKRAKDKSWLDVFVVIQKGQLNMFTFGDHTSGMSGTFGGGNWLANAHPVGTIGLAHSLAHALPPPGYHKRPHCMVLTLASRGVYFFQAGTEELVNEWVSTCNYWAARTSKEPLAGGVSNMEYGWNRVMPDIYGDDEGGGGGGGGGSGLGSGSVGAGSQVDFHQREELFPDSVSVRSGKSTRSKYGWRSGSEGTATVRGAGGFASPRGDKTFINDWKAPLPPTVSSLHDEETQLDALKKHVASLKQEIEKHNELREPMAALYQPRTANAMKAQSNWEEKSQYLLREIVKYDLYIDSLQAAISLRLKKRGEKALEHALSHATPVDDPTASGKRWKGLQESISEEAEPTTPSAQTQFLHQSRGRAEDDDDADD